MVHAIAACTCLAGLAAAGTSQWTLFGELTGRQTSAGQGHHNRSIQNA